MEWYILKYYKTAALTPLFTAATPSVWEQTGLLPPCMALLTLGFTLRMICSFYVSFDDTDKGGFDDIDKGLIT